MYLSSSLSCMLRRIKFLMKTMRFVIILSFQMCHFYIQWRRLKISVLCLSLFMILCGWDRIMMLNNFSFVRIIIKPLTMIFSKRILENGLIGCQTLLYSNTGASDRWPSWARLCKCGGTSLGCWQVSLREGIQQTQIQLMSFKKFISPLYFTEKLARRSTTSCALALACRPSVSKKKNEKSLLVH